METYKIENEEGRLDKVVSTIQKNISRMTIQKMIENGDILVNDNIKKTSYKVNSGDIITIKDIQPEETDLKPEGNIPLDIIYEDNDIIIINKEKGIVVHPGNGNRSGTLANGIMARCKDSLSGVRWEVKTWYST